MMIGIMQIGQDIFSQIKKGTVGIGITGEVTSSPRPGFITSMRTHSHAMSIGDMFREVNITRKTNYMIFLHTIDLMHSREKTGGREEDITNNPSSHTFSIIKVLFV